MSVVRRPLSLLLATAILAAESVALLAVAALVLIDGAGGAGGAGADGVASAILLLCCVAALGGCTWGCWALRSWARAPAIVAQLILLGVAWDFHDGRLPVTLGLAAVAVAAVVTLLHPATSRALAAEEQR